MKLLKDLIKKKMEAGDMMPEKSKEAMENVLKELDDLAEEGMAGKLQKVTVASDSEEGLKEGLEMAEESVEEMSEGDEMSDMDKMAEGAKMDERDDYMAQSSDSDEDYDSMSEDELEAKIRELEEMKNKMA